MKVVVDKSQATARYTLVTFLANQGVPCGWITGMPSCTKVHRGGRGDGGDRELQYTPGLGMRNEENVWCSTIPGGAAVWAGMEPVVGESEEMKARY